MVVNAVAPWEGQLIWVGTPNGGVSQNGQEWKSVEFTLKYQDMRLQEKHIVFSAFGLDIVNRILSTPLGTNVRVTWSPDARQGQDGRWWGKFSVFGFTAVQPTAMAPQPQAPTYQQPAPQYAQPAPAPQYPPQGTQMPQQTPAYQQPVQQFAPQPAPQADGDLPW